tara:strand:- start:2432 stop:3079 length:648 start_codon:yes stop_codon:yes gene_type:complete
MQTVQSPLPTGPLLNTAGQARKPKITEPGASFLSVLFSMGGRMRRTTYWAIQLGSGFGVLFAVGAFGSLLFDMEVFELLTGNPDLEKISSSTFLAGTLVILGLWWWILLASTVKRWHDRDKSGWWIWINFVPVIGGFWALIENGFLGASPRGGEVNNYGRDERNRTGAIVAGSVVALFLIGCVGLVIWTEFAEESQATNVIGDIEHSANTELPSR